MKHLFSPWRSEYINSFGKKSRNKECLFCRIAKEKKRDKHNLIVWRGRYCFVVLNRFPYNAGHLMIVPYKHTSNFAKLTENENLEVMNILSKSINAIDSISKPHGYNYGANLGRVAGAGIDKHIHFHLVPRWNGDTNFMPVVAETKIVSEELKKMQKLLQAVFQKA